MTTLTITHSSDAGTLLEGTSRGDGAAEAVKALRWRWGHSIGCWYIPRSRFSLPDRRRINEAVGVLESAGFEVLLEIDTAPVDPARAEDVRAERSQARVERLTERAEKHDVASAKHHEKSRALAARIPLGQPILAGHHSQARAERDAEKISRDMGKSIEHSQQAEQARTAAAAAAADKNPPETVANRIGKLSAQIRYFERTLHSLQQSGNQDSTYAVETAERLEHAQTQALYWQQVREEQIRAGRATNYGRDSVHAGDLVKIRGQWYIVVRANAKTVSVKVEAGWDNKSLWAKVQDHRRPTASEEKQ